jgi:hypothetical protein
MVRRDRTFRLYLGTSESSGAASGGWNNAVVCDDQSAELGPLTNLGLAIPAILPKRRSSQLWNVSM